MAVPLTDIDSRSPSASSASSASSTPTSSLKHPLPARPLASPSPAPFTPVQPTFNLMTPTPPPSTTRPQPDSPSDNSKLARKWRASPLTSQLTNLDKPTLEQTSPVQLPAPAANPQTAASSAFNNTTPNPLQTTNVYINGLPPHFKDEELYALASRFGTVLSCRTFTRQLSDTPSGYGFVLFESIDSAQECINVLRSHHNLHPHFAKAHKIPGVPSYTPEDTTVGQAGDIYIEGLPMHVDAPTLRALLAPHNVLSSRFFADTRVQPPLLVAFVRLATHAAAQDVYGRLHGRTVRGYSARLAVSLADVACGGDAPIDVEMDMNCTSGMPAPHPDTYDPFADTDFSFASQTQNQLQTHSNTNNHGQNYSPHQTHHSLPQSQYQRPVDELLHTLQGLNMHTPRVQPLQPLSTTLQELQTQLENLRPLLAAYGTPNAPNHAQNQPQPLVMQNLHPQNLATPSHLGARNQTMQTQQRLRSLSQSHEQLLVAQPGIGGHSRSHTTGHVHALGHGTPLFSQPTPRHASNPEKAPGSERAWRG